MSKEGLNPYQAQEKRITFIEKAVRERVLERIPVSERNQNIALVYILNEEVSGEKLRQIFPGRSGKPLTTQRVNQIKKRFLEESWKRTSPQLQTCHPLEELLIRKPNALSETNARIKHITEREIIDPKNIKNTEGIEVLHNARTTLRRHGIKIPFIPTAYEYFKEKVEKENDDKKLQKMLDEPSANSLVRFIGHHRKDQEKVLVDLSSVLREAGFYPHTHLEFFAKKLRANNIPVRGVNMGHRAKGKYKETHWVVYEKRKQRIADALRDDPDLQKFKENPIQLVCGNFDGKTLTTYALQNKKQYRTNLVSLAKNFIHGYPDLLGLLKDCPVPVFKMYKRYYYPLDQIEELKAFLKSKQVKT